MGLSHNWSCGLVAVFGGYLYGYNTGIIGGLSKPLIYTTFFPSRPSSDQSTLQGVLTAEILLGGFIGSFLGVSLANRWGRKMALLVMGVIGLISAIVMSVSQSFALLVIARTVMGLAVGFSGCVCPMYVAEMADSHIRGRMGTTFQIAICASILLAQIMNYAVYPKDVDEHTVLSDWQWQLQFGLGGIPGVLLIILSRMIPESIAYRRPLDGDMNADLENVAYVPMAGSIDDPSASPSPNIDSSIRGGWRELFSKKGLGSLFIALVLAMAAQLTGINAIIFYAPNILKDAGLNDVLVLTIAVVGVWNLVSVFISFALVDRLGRRPLMLMALVLMSLGTGLLSLAYEAFPAHKSVIAIISILMFIGAFECGPGPLFFLMASESFPESVREEALSVANALAWIFNIMISFGFPVVNDAAGSAAVFFIFTIAGVVSGTLIFFFLPETKGRTLGKDRLITNTERHYRHSQSEPFSPDHEAY